jgi:hypothetical protein
MKVTRRPSLPLAPLLRSYVEAGLRTGAELAELAGLGLRVRAILDAPGDFFSAAFLDSAGEAEFQTALVHFYEQCVQPPLHVPTLRRHVGFLRHALAHLLRCADPLPRKAERCLGADGPYRVAGLGPAFWSALFQALDPVHYPSWTPAILLGMRRLGLATWPPHEGPARTYAASLTSTPGCLSRTRPSRPCTWTTSSAWRR